jgi:hypothetical protein
MYSGHLKTHADRYFPFIDMGDYYYSTMAGLTVIFLCD